MSSFSESSTPASKTDVILKSSADWEAWIAYIQMIAKHADVWDLINPDVAVEPALPQPPQKPVPSIVRPGATSEADLDEKQLRLLERKENSYYNDQGICRQQKDAIRRVMNAALSTVTAANLVYAKTEDTPYRQLLALKKRLTPTDRAKELDMTRKYNLLKNARGMSQKAETKSEPTIWEPLEDDEIRLLSVRGGLSFYLTCVLERVKIPIEDQGDYSALSYTWGPPSDRARAVPISINGDVTSVWPNLHAALIAIWSQDARMKIWADALSIDQQNDSERSEQVSLMSRIFGMARTVVVWLGKLAPLNREPMRRTWEVIQTIRSDSHRALADIVQAVFPEDYEWRPSLVSSLQLLSENEWFYRAWIAQEIILAQSAEVWYGHLRTEWGDFEEGCRTLINNLGVQVLLRMPWDEIKHCRELVRNTTPTMTNLLIATYQRRATDPRDKIFALIGLLPDASYRANYTETHADASLRIVEYCITHDKSLMILELAQGFQPAWDCSEADEELPEWAMISTNFDRGKVKYYASAREQYEGLYWSDFIKDNPWDRKLLSWCPDFENMESLSKRVISRFRTRLNTHHKPPEIVRTARRESIGLAGYVLGAIYQCISPYFQNDRVWSCWKLRPISHRDDMLQNMTVVLRYTLEQSFRPTAREADNVDVLDALKEWWSAADALTATEPFHDYSGKEISTCTTLKHFRSGVPLDAYDGDWVCILPGADKLCVLRPYVHQIVNDISLPNFLCNRLKFRLEKFRFIGMIQSEISENLTEDWLNTPLVWANFMLV